MKTKKTPLWVKDDQLELVKGLLRSNAYEFWNERQVLYFHLLTAVVTSIAWIGIALLIFK